MSKMEKVFYKELVLPGHEDPCFQLKYGEQTVVVRLEDGLITIDQAASEYFGIPIKDLELEEGWGDVES